MNNIAEKKYISKNIILFPQTADYNSLRYLISLGFICVVKDPFCSIGIGWLLLHSIDRLDIYKYTRLQPLPKLSKMDVIRVFQLKKIHIESDA